MTILLENIAIHRQLFAIAEQMVTLLVNAKHPVLTLLDGAHNAYPQLTLRALTDAVDAQLLPLVMHNDDAVTNLPQGDVILKFMYVVHPYDVTEGWLLPLADAQQRTGVMFTRRFQPKPTHVLMLSVNIMHRAWVREAFEQLVTAVVNERVNNVTLASRVAALHCDVKPEFKYTNAELAAQIEQCQMIGQAV